MSDVCTCRPLEVVVDVGSKECSRYRYCKTMYEVGPLQCILLVNNFVRAECKRVVGLDVRVAGSRPLPYPNDIFSASFNNHDAYISREYTNVYLSNSNPITRNPINLNPRALIHPLKPRTLHTPYVEMEGGYCERSTLGLRPQTPSIP